jgi:hypothetical protein
LTAMLTALPLGCERVKNQQQVFALKQRILFFYSLPLLNLILQMQQASLLLLPSAGNSTASTASAILAPRASPMAAAENTGSPSPDNSKHRGRSP